MFFDIKQKLLKRKLIIALNDMAENFIKNLFLVSTVKKEVKELNKKDKYVYGIKITGKSKTSEDVIDTMMLILEIFNKKGSNNEEKKYKIRIIDNIKLNPDKFTQEEARKIFDEYKKFFEKI